MVSHPPRRDRPWAPAAILFLFPLFLAVVLQAQDLSKIRVLVNGSPDQYHMHQVPLGRTLLADLGRTLGYQHSYHTDFRWVHADTLAKYQVLVWAVGRPDSIPVAGRAHVEGFLAKGGSIVVIHTGLQRFGDWTGWNLILGGTQMNGHPAAQNARVVREDATHAITRGLAAEWRTVDENYSLNVNPRGRNGNTVLVNLDEKSYNPGSYAMGDHPAVWIHEARGGRVFVTLLGHNTGTWNTDTNFRTLVQNAIAWAAEPHLDPSAVRAHRALGRVGGLLKGRRLAFPELRIPVRLRFHDVAGRPVREDVLLPGQALDLVAMPAGVYLLKADGEGFSLGRNLVLP
jgi:type 1 glutamine amidotransferase